MKRTVAEALAPQPDQSGLPRTIAKSIYRRLRQDILWGRFAPGSPLRSDQLRARYDVGISPLREALTRLASERLVTAVGQRGFRVAPLTAYDVEDTMATRLVIEGEALARSIRARRYSVGNVGCCRFSCAIAQSDTQGTGSFDRTLGAATSPVPHGVAVGLRLAVAHGACRSVVRSGGTPPDIAVKIRVAKNTETGHGAGA